MRTSIGLWLRKTVALGAGVSCLALMGCDRSEDRAPSEGTTSVDEATPDDTVLGTPDGGGLADRLSDDARFSTSRGLLRSAGLTTLSRGSASRTVFAPTNSAFGAFFEQVNDGEKCASYLATGQGLSLLRTIFAYHVVPEKFASQAIVSAIEQQADGSLEVDTVLRENGASAQLVVEASDEGEGVGLVLNGGNASFGGANVIFADIFVPSGVLHVVDRLLLSPGVRSLLAGLPADAACRPKPGNLVEVAASNPSFFNPG
jgi:uncharacterized surface protein with fasciclin (FAS1) repeats